MYINNLLIDSIEVDFLFCDTLKKQEERVKELCHYLANEHFSKSFVAHIDPEFSLQASSKANKIIESDFFSNKLVPELENELKNKKSPLRICK